MKYLLASYFYFWLCDPLAVDDSLPVRQILRAEFATHIIGAEICSLGAEADEPTLKPGGWLVSLAKY